MKYDVEKIIPLYDSIKNKILSNKFNNRIYNQNMQIY